jgi:acyl-CoA oxidase
LASALKPTATWHRVKVLQECREACGGMGFHASNRIGALRNDADIDVGVFAYIATQHLLR